jgi:hypothetical protein
MLSKEILHGESYKTHKYKMHSYWLLQQVVSKVLTGLWRVNDVVSTESDNSASKTVNK